MLNFSGFNRVARNDPSTSFDDNSTTFMGKKNTPITLKHGSFFPREIGVKII